jgi:cytochrome d ubiquinol oxidase subunit II
MEHQVPEFLIHVWMSILTLMLYIYVALDGFDLGIGILSLFERDRRRQAQMMDCLNGIWDANETWLVLLGGTLFGAFPLAYANVLQALYMPVLLMLFALIFRGVSLEFRVYSERPSLWTLAFGMGSLLAAIAQGLALGTLLGGLPLYAEESPVEMFVWATPLSFLAAVVLTALYILLGSCYLLGKVDIEFRDTAYRWARLTARSLPWLFVLLIGLLALKMPYLTEQWRAHPFGFGGLTCTLAALYFMLLRNLNLQRDHQPFYWSLAALAATFIFLLASHYPYLIPGAMTLHMAASSANTLEFMLYAVGGLLPLMLAYNAYQYYVFRGRVTSEHQ